MSDAKRKNRGRQCRGCGKARSSSVKQAIATLMKGRDGRYCLKCYVARLKRRANDALPHGRSRPPIPLVREAISFDRFFSLAMEAYAPAVARLVAEGI